MSGFKPAEIYDDEFVGGVGAAAFAFKEPRPRNIDKIGRSGGHGSNATTISMTVTGRSNNTPQQCSPPISLTPIHIKRHAADVDGGFCSGHENYNPQLLQAAVAHHTSLKPLNIDQVLTPAKFEPMVDPSAQRLRQQLGQPTVDDAMAASMI